MAGFTIPTFIPDGNPASVRLLQRSTHTGRLVTCNRAFLAAALKRRELGKPGIYLLLGTRPDTAAPLLYVGQSDNVADRIKSHDTAKDFWNKLAAYVAVDPPFNKAHVRFLEARMVQLAKEAGHALDNKDNPSLPPLGEADLADMDTHVDDLLLLLQIAGIDVVAQASAPARSRVFHFTTRHVDATGYPVTGGFLVKEGSLLRTELLQSATPGTNLLREQLIKDGVIGEGPDGSLVLTKDHVFTSSSTAANVFGGGSFSGPKSWKDKSGMMLKEVEQEG